MSRDFKTNILELSYVSLDFIYFSPLNQVAKKENVSIQCASIRVR